jgi:hypothetical protein
MSISQVAFEAPDWSDFLRGMRSEKKPSTLAEIPARCRHCNERLRPVVARVCDNNMQAAAMSSAVATPVPFAGE